MMHGLDSRQFLTITTEGSMVKQSSIDQVIEEVEQSMAEIRQKSFLEIAEEKGVDQTSFLNYLKTELDNESSCLELPMTFMLFLCFSVMAIAYLRQVSTYAVENAIKHDIYSNANFAWSHFFGHKTIMDVNSFADFWSWFRLGLVPLVIQPTWSWSESYGDGIGSNVFPVGSFDLSQLPSRIGFEDLKVGLPLTNDYLHYNRMVGGIRMRQGLAEYSFDNCIFPTKTSLSSDMMRFWLGKPCTKSRLGEEDIEPPETFSFENPQRTEWLLPEMYTLPELLAQAIDMEDGCSLAVSMGYDMSTCRCENCRPSGEGYRKPWLDELTDRIEVSFVTYNPVYGLYTYTGVNLFFNRGGHIYKYINTMSSWASILNHPIGEKIVIFGFGALWVVLMVHIFLQEAKEIFHVVRKSKDRFYKALWDDYIGPWNVVDLCALTVSATVLVLLLRLQLAAMITNTSFASFISSGLPTDPNFNKDAYMASLSEFFAAVEQMTSREKNFRQALYVYPCFVILRLFKSFAAQPRLALVTSTLSSAFVDMYHFFIVMFSVYACMTMNSIVLFGHDIENFSSVLKAGQACFQAIFGDLDWEAIQGIGQVKAGIYFWIFLIVMRLLLLNFMVAIIMDAYAGEKEKAEAAITILQQIRQMIRRRRQFTGGQRVRLNDIFDAFEAEYSGDLQAMYAEERIVTVDHLIRKVPKLQRKQALILMSLALEKAKVEAQRSVTEVDQKESIRRRLEEMLETQEKTAKEAQKARDVVEGFDRLQVYGDPEFEHYFGVVGFGGLSAGDGSVARSVTEASSKVGKLLVKSMSHIESMQENVERQQDELHHTITEIQLMIAHEAKALKTLSMIVSPQHARESDE